MDCCDSKCSSEDLKDRRYRKVLWIALVINAAMFFVEMLSSVKADSVSLLADAADFLGDAANYGISISVLALAPIWRSRTALLKGITMGVYGVFVLGTAFWSLYSDRIPEAPTMGIIGLLALFANVSVAVMLFRFRAGDSNKESVWLCSRNDAIGNLAVLGAAASVYFFQSRWPDFAVAVLMSVLGLTAAVWVIGSARKEMAA
jgi:Co/Zn/Cd efflux system component